MPCVRSERATLASGKRQVFFKWGIRHARHPSGDHRKMNKDDLSELYACRWNVELTCEI